MGSQQEVFKCGVSVSPIVDWLYYSKLDRWRCWRCDFSSRACGGFIYEPTLRLISFPDSAFTERILGLPVENYKSYVEADATQRARYIPSNSFFLMHGLSDYSAPHVHGTKLARALTEAGVLFRYQVSVARRSGGSELTSRSNITTPNCIVCLCRATQTKVTNWAVCWSMSTGPWKTISPIVSVWTLRSRRRLARTIKLFLWLSTAFSSPPWNWWPIVMMMKKKLPQPPPPGRNKKLSWQRFQNERGSQGV